MRWPVAVIINAVLPVPLFPSITIWVIQISCGTRKVYILNTVSCPHPLIVFEASQYVLRIHCTEGMVARRRAGYMLPQCTR